MNERDYLDHHARITADNVTATIESANDDGTYMVRTIGTRALRRASTANPVDQFKVGQRVIISEPSASRNVIGAEAVIQSRAPRDQRGLSATTPAESRDFSSTTFITGIDPDPLVLVAGGEPGEQTIMGRGFDEAATYSATGDLPDPIVANEDAPVVTTTKIVMIISADADSPSGTFDLFAGSAHARAALRITPALPAAPVTDWLIVSGEVELVDASLLAVLWVLNPSDLTIARSVELVADRSFGLTAVDGLVYWITKTGATYHLRIVDPATGDLTTAALTALNFSPYGGAQLVAIDGRLVIGSSEGADAGLWSFAMDGSDGTHEWTDGNTASTDDVGIAFDDDAIYVCGFGSTSRLDRVTFAQEDFDLSPDGSRIIAIRAWTEGGGYGAFTGQLCVTGAGADVRWIAASDVSVDETFNVGSGNFRGPVQIEDHIYFAAGVSDTLYRASLDGTVVDTIGVITGFAPLHGSISTDGTDLFFLTTATAKRAGVDASILATSPTLDSADPSAFVDLQQTLYVSS